MSSSNETVPNFKGSIEKINNYVKEYRFISALILGSAISGCGGYFDNGENHAPTLGNPNISTSIMEGTTGTGNLNDSLPSDLDGDAFTFNIIGVTPLGLIYDKNTGAYSYDAPMVSANKTTTLQFNVTDTKGATSLIPITLDITSVDGAYDAPLSVGAITGASNVGILSGAIFSVDANDLDGIQNSLFSIIDDSNGVEVVSNVQLKTNIVITPGIGGNTYDITLLPGLIPTIGAYTLKTSFMGVTFGQKPSSQLITKTFSFNMVKDAPALAKYTGFITTTNSVSGNIACSDGDNVTPGNSIVSEYAIRLQGSLNPVTYTAFPNPSGGPINFISLADGTPLTPGTSYEVLTRIISTNASTNNPNFVTDFSNVFTTELPQVAPIMGVISDVTVVNGGIVNIDAGKSVILTNRDPILSYGLTGALPTGLIFNSVTGVLSGSTAVTGTYNFSISATDNDGVSNSAPFTLNVNALNTAPTAQNVTLAALSGSPVTYNVNPNIADAQSPDNLLNVNVSTPPANGTLTWTGHQFTYTANPGFSGTDTFTYFVVDPGTLKSAIKTVTINNIVAILAPTISMADQIVNDNAGAIATALPAPTFTGVVTGAVFSLVTDPTGGKLTINSTTGVATRLGNDIGGLPPYNINIKITNPDGGNKSVIFALTVINNG